MGIVGYGYWVDLVKCECINMCKSINYIKCIVLNYATTEMWGMHNFNIKVCFFAKKKEGEKKAKHCEKGNNYHSISSLHAERQQREKSLLGKKKKVLYCSYSKVTVFKHSNKGFIYQFQPYIREK